MSYKKSKEQLTKDFNFVIDCARECGKDAARTESLHTFTTSLSYIDSFLRGGKLTQKEAEQQVKDLYKAWKSTNKAIDSE
jgi:hypothetical protein